MHLILAAVMTAEEAAKLNAFFFWAVVIIFTILGPPAVLEMIRDLRKPKPKLSEPPVPWDIKELELKVVVPPKPKPRRLVGRSLPPKEDIKADIIRIIKRGHTMAGQTVAKSNVLRMVKGKYCQYGRRQWEGISRWQKDTDHLIDVCMSELIQDGEVRYIPQKPLEIIPE